MVCIIILLPIHPEKFTFLFTLKTTYSICKPLPRNINNCGSPQVESGMNVRNREQKLCEKKAQLSARRNETLTFRRTAKRRKVEKANLCAWPWLLRNELSTTSTTYGLYVFWKNKNTSWQFFRSFSIFLDCFSPHLSIFCRQYVVQKNKKHGIEKKKNRNCHTPNVTGMFSSSSRRTIFPLTLLLFSYSTLIFFFFLASFILLSSPPYTSSVPTKYYSEELDVSSSLTYSHL